MEEMDPVVWQENDEELKPEPSHWYEGHISLEDAKTFIKSNITTAARSFIAIGFYLKCVRDRELFREEEYDTVWDFAKAEYGISKSTASRYMSMNDRFSENGNSPNIRAEYRAFGKSQLQEMLYLEDDQLDQVKPEDRVEDIRSLRKPKEVPYIELPGQMEIEIDFPDILPDLPEIPVNAQKQTFEMNVEDMLSDDRESVAISQQEHGPDPEEIQEIDHFFNRNESIDDAYGWFRSKMVQEYLKSGYKEPNEECEIKVLGSLHRVLKRKDVTVFHDISGTATFDVENARLEREYDYFFRDHNVAESDSKEPGTVIETPENVPEQPRSVSESHETVIDGEFVEVSPEKELSARSILEEEKQELHDWIKVYQDEGLEMPPMVERQKIIVAALTAMVCELEAIEPEPVKPEQPELPILKNNDQRAAFIDAYETWLLWIETKETGERYYRYDLSDGTSIVAKVYHARIFDYKAPGSYEDKFREDWGEEEYYLLQEGKFFRNCRTCRADLIEKLKELQKKKES